VAYQIRLGSDTIFQAEEGETLLAAAARAGITLAYSCRNGRCSTCKCQVLSGSTRALQPETGLTGEESAAGWVLACVRSATGDAAIEAERMPQPGLAPARIVPCRIDNIVRLAPDVVGVTLRLPPAAAFSFLPGQYIDVIIRSGARRSYSLASASATLLELHIRQVDGGVLSDYWFGAAQPNDLLRVNGPLGTAVLRDIAGQDLVFLATGTGIAPVKSMLEAIAASAPEERPASISVYWGGRVAPDLYWDVQAVDAGQHYVPVLSRAGPEWQGARGHVQDVFLASGPDLARCIVHACGSDSMVRAAGSMLVAAGLAPQRFHADAFVASDT
jgi:CDP-4-dehydro-6-deoxyglucose reductase